MTHWTDDHLADLLTATFAAHEEDADPVVAHGIALSAAPPSRRVRPVAVVAAAVVVLVIAVTAQVLRPEHRTPEPAPTPTPTEIGDNRTLAAAEAESLLADVPLPPRARPVASPPAPGLRRPGAHIFDVDPSLTRTGWWIVPISYHDLVAWYAANVPDAHADEDLTWWTASGTSAYTAPAVTVSFAHRGEASAAMRVDVTLAARDDRTAATFVPREATSIEITRTDVTGPLGPPATVVVSDPVRIRAVADVFNDLDGAASGARPAGCGSPVGDLHVYSVTFRWPGHALAVDPGAPLCGRGRSLVLDGTALAPRLEDTAGFNAVLAAAF